ncbi:3-keto-disaccharide hydrolase [Aureliella helgolandensis]|uniref:3-keto-alpha-glucoside-1,2-lyase/3-keto-2-hydroxy-glucal hydratase domain-containing protein n=1 Tax=Aureliella helgolandensis TaxID=2527968 RepID=A0A518GH19_9BACT|nr:DUF1080 domain-containing protein [Aureliella helgolandensis]QDV27858.1 hypothetical protein Q31a_62510 [Aureliella helgolandensis]
MHLLGKFGIPFPRMALATSLAILGCGLVGCNPQPKEQDSTAAEHSKDESPATSSETPDASAVDATASNEAAAEVKPLGPLEIDLAKLLTTQLTPEQLDEGWVSLFDGQSLLGWFAVGIANWHVQDGVLSVSQGERSFLCTSFQLRDFELQLDFRSEATTNSGVFLRTSPLPEDVATESLELNIAPADNPFPTGSFVERQKLEPEELGEFDATQWHTYRVRLDGDHITVHLDGQEVMNFEDSLTADQGHISLQFREGKVEFRNILMRPIHAQPLATGEEWEQDWVASSKEGAEFSVTAEADGLQLSGGLGQVQSKQAYGDFFLHATYTLAKPEVNSGIFFRCIPDAMLDGYECQVNHAVLNDDPSQPADSGAGAIFRRQTARVVVGDGTTPTHLALLASGNQIASWVNGVLVVDFQDNRAPDENPRNGLRLEPGPISLQGHDPTTQVTYHSLDISQLYPPK